MLRLYSTTCAIFFRNYVLPKQCEMCSAGDASGPFGICRIASFSTWHQGQLLTLSFRSHWRALDKRSSDRKRKCHRNYVSPLYRRICILNVSCSHVSICSGLSAGSAYFSNTQASPSIRSLASATGRPRKRAGPKQYTLTRYLPIIKLIGCITISSFLFYFWNML